MSHVLLVDDDPAVRSALARYVARHGHSINQASDALEGVEAIERLSPDLVVTDMEMPRGGGFAVLEAGSRANIPVVILTAHASVELAVDAMKRGAANFLTKPFTADNVSQMLEEAFGQKSSSTSPHHGGLRAGRREIGGTKQETGVIGEDEAFQGVLRLVERVADTDARILITGESGTGKEVVAHAIHNASRRRDKPFVAVNCGAIPEQLLESELFGHVKGAFTGATQARRGRFAMAEGGTLFLDEIGDMPMVLQVKLLRVIQNLEYEVLGDSRPQPLNVRIIAATHRNLEKYVAEDKFREDLYYRLNVVPLHLPPLRERVGDIPLLVEYFITQVNEAYGRQVSGITPEALDVLSQYPWPGNIRELGNVVERMVVIRGQGKLDVADLPPGVKPPRGGWQAAAGGGPKPVALPHSGIDLGEALLHFEGSLIEQALERTHGNRTQAAALLRINRTTLVEKLKRREPTSQPSPDEAD